MFERTWALLKAIWGAVWRQDWVSIRGNLGLVHALWTAVVICILVGVVIFGLLKYIGWLQRRPIAALLCGFLFLSGLIGIMTVYDYWHQPAKVTTCGSVCAPVTVFVPAGQWIKAFQADVPLTVRLTASGAVSGCDPRGNGQRANQNYQAPAAPQISLVGQVDGQAPFYVGPEKTLRVPTGKTLWLAVNDPSGRASGTFQVNVAVL